jgi:hypothetical protein
MNLCSVDSCESQNVARGFCGMHYQRWRKFGDPHFVKPRRGNDKPRPVITCRTCKDCGCSGDLSLFISGRNLCKPCGNAYKKRWQKENPDKHAAILERSRAYQEKYELSRSAVRLGQDPEHVQELRKTHDGFCDLCGGPPIGNRKRLSVDHCHETGVFRGFLCGMCNSGLGYFKDSPDVLRRAASYVEKFQ